MEILFDFFSNQVVSSLALTLIHFIWQGALIGVLLWFVLLCIPKNKFNLRYRLAVFALLLIVIAPVLTFSITSEQTLNYQTSTFNDIGNNSLSESSNSDSAIVNNKSPRKLNEWIENKEYSDYLGQVLIVWILGCLLMSVKFVLDLNRTFRLTKEGVAEVSEQIEQVVQSLSSSYKITRAIKILKSRKVNVPVVIGWLRPVILLPIAITIGLDKKHLELIIAHELAHIKRMDFAVNLVQSVIQICLFYHPVVYWVNRVIRDEREYICDQLALNVLGNDESAKINLAKALLGTEELREGNLSLVAVAASGGMLKHRISHILDSQYKPATSLKSVLLGGVVFMFSFAALSTTVSFSEYQMVSVENIEQVVNQTNRVIEKTKL